jgi:hypothetical protein
MRRKLLLIAIVIAAAVTGFGQSVTVTPRKVVYKRPKPIMDFKKEFSVIYPKITGVSRPLAAKIEKTISYASAFKFRVRDELGEYQWLEEASYDVDYNKRGILSVYLTLMGTGAYTSSFGKNVVVDLRTGNRVTPRAVFVNLDRLAAICRQRQEEEMKASLEAIRRDEPGFAESANEFFKIADFKAANLDWFLIDDNGVTFVYEYGFPRIALNLQPDGRYVFSWAELKPYIKRGGLLAKFIR